MGLFSSSNDRASDSALDAFVGQVLLPPKLFLTKQPGEQKIRVFGQTIYADTRQNILNKALNEGLPFWQGKVVLEQRVVTEEGSLPKQVFAILANDGECIGELSEFDRSAQAILDFDGETSYLARAVIQDDLIGNLVQLFIDPANRA
ncbi:hypothetical protein [Rhodoluna sp.]|uniref:hypothetical protein n=1 Tax=Rhodoluna sp. TaxID=1969481 RepID=UPI0025D2BEA0|nr:hypothetical protein [Rhodoluna sp.]